MEVQIIVIVSTLGGDVYTSLPGVGQRGKHPSSGRCLYLHHSHQHTSLISLCSLDDIDFILWQIRGTVILNDLQGAGPQASKKGKIEDFE